ncbi:MAG: hypothetical protein KGL10_08155 [Alphaproteobacteria bacterium]|nr:hypothetical protein [Alphaproteobacteria bacterium]MDE2337271.1 hypothetical protein [Alphaproteobacteria bacterium]
MAANIALALSAPYAIALFMYEKSKEAKVKNEEMYQALAGEYAKFNDLLIRNADLRLRTDPVPDGALSPEQKERKKIIFDSLVSLFEQAFILVYEKKMDRESLRLWSTWEDYIIFWCKRPDFRAFLPELLPGEDPDFVAYIRSIAKLED